MSYNKTYMNPDQERDIPLTSDHRRQWLHCRYVYPVIARRSKGLSIGVNLNPERGCNFACLYCQIDRRVERRPCGVDLDILRDELRLALREAMAGTLWDQPRFASAPAPMRRINDIAFSGDGEPTCVEDFDQAVQAAAQVKGELPAHDVKIVVITNSSRFDSPQFERALPILDAHNGEVWAKLDAGTEDRFRVINRPKDAIALERIVGNIIRVSRARAIVIQSLFFRLSGQPPPPGEIREYCGRLRDILRAGGRIKLVQAHTIARPPMDASASALDDAQMDVVAHQIRSALPDLNVETYYGQNVGPQEQA